MIIIGIQRWQKRFFLKTQLSNSSHKENLNRMFSLGVWKIGIRERYSMIDLRIFHYGSRSILGLADSTEQRLISCFDGYAKMGSAFLPGSILDLSIQLIFSGEQSFSTYVCSTTTEQSQ